MQPLTAETALFRGFKDNVAREALGGLAVSIARHDHQERYGTIIAEGTSGRIPALVVAGVYKNLLGLDKPPRVITFLPYCVIRVPESFNSSKATPTRALIVTEYANSGGAVKSVAESASKLGVPKERVDIATVESSLWAQEQLRKWAHPNQTLFLNEPYTDSFVYQAFYTHNRESARDQSDSLAARENTFPYDIPDIAKNSVLRARVVEEIKSFVAEYSER